MDRKTASKLFFHLSETNGQQVGLSLDAGNKVRFVYWKPKLTLEQATKRHDDAVKAIEHLRFQKLRTSQLAIANEPHLKEQALALTPASRQKLQAQAKRRCLPESVHAQTVRRSSDRKGGAGGEHLEEEGLIDTANRSSSEKEQKDKKQKEKKKKDKRKENEDKEDKERGETKGRVTPPNGAPRELFNLKNWSKSTWLLPHQRISMNDFYNEGELKAPSQVLTPKSAEIMALSRRIMVAPDQIIKYCKSRQEVYGPHPSDGGPCVEFSSLMAVRFKCHLCGHLCFQRCSINEHYSKIHQED
eukprot:g13309.t1